MIEFLKTDMPILDTTCNAKKSVQDTHDVQVLVWAYHTHAAVSKLLDRTAVTAGSRHADAQKILCRQWRDADTPRRPPLCSRTRQGRPPMVQQQAAAAGAHAVSGFDQALASAAAALANAGAVAGTLPQALAGSGGSTAWAASSAASPASSQQPAANVASASRRVVNDIMRDLKIGGRPITGGNANSMSSAQAGVPTADGASDAAAANGLAGAKQRGNRKPKGGRKHGGAGASRRRDDSESEEAEDEYGLGLVAEEAAALCREALQALHREARWSGEALANLNQAFASIVQASLLMPCL